MLQNIDPQNITSQVVGKWKYSIQVNLDMTDHCKTDYSSMTDKMLGPSPMHIKYLPYVYDGFCI